MASPTTFGSFSAWDYVVFVAILLISALVGIYHAVVGRGRESTEDFLLGSHQMSSVPVALSLTASFMSAVTMLGAPYDTYHFGAVNVYFAISYMLVVILSAKVFLPIFYRLGVTSSYEYLELRFNRWVRLCGTILFMIQTILYTGIVIYAPALALNQVTNFNLWGSIISTGVVCTFYCTLGGLKAVVWTDVFQIVIMVIGLVAVIVQAIVVKGGISKVLNTADHGGRLNFWNFDPNPFHRHTFWTIVIGGTFTWTGIYGVNQAQVQRYISCKTQTQAKVALYLNLVGLWIMLVCTVLSGLAMYSLYYDCDPWTSGKVTAPDQLMPYMVLDILGSYPGLPGLFVACTCCGTLSTVSSSINALTAVTVQDLIKPHFTTLSEKRLAWISKAMSLLFGAVCIGMAGLASLMGSLLQAALSIFGIVGGPILGLFTLGILFSWANCIGGIVGLISGFAFTLWIGIGAQIWPPPPEVTMPLNLSVSGCNVSQSRNETSWETTILLTTLSETSRKDRAEAVMSLYSLSYLYLSTFAILIVIIVGLIVSLLTGGRKSQIDTDLLLNWTDLFCDCPTSSRGDGIEVMESIPCQNRVTGNDNLAFSHM
ncbi:sodium-coupled monocarboxylate transporter 1-like isoform X1 [Chiloscyllium plagiosum]|uniref:sodium-coupled monocarboxylate transporter 1-like isoform X1 n=1 Tax=Chiloscyllium plagiosum TaxID=36176 RepID=UPI001CB80FB3|nr:sodium-coupled monocarboxylate transporter 1-like isoform X1 [Chiloscyllium plagiosum]